MMGIPRVFKYCTGIFFFLMQLSFSSNAQNLEQPTGLVILTISGEIEAQNDSAANTETDSTQDRTAYLDLSMLESLGLTTITTETPWTEGLIEFNGILMRDLLELVKANGESVKAVGLDDYIVEIPVEDFFDNDVILATRNKGTPMKVRNNGPLWIIYPWTEVPALRRPRYYARSIWQLKSLIVLP